MDPLDALTRLADQLREPRPLEGLLQLIADAAAATLGVRRASVRLLDPAATTLLATARAGEPFHDQPAAFRPGEGLIGWIAERGEVVRVADAEADPRFVARAGQTGRMGAFLGAPIRAGAHSAGVVSAVSPDRPFDVRDERLIVLLAALCGPYLEIARLARLSRVDPLTGALNRRGLDDEFPEAVTGGDGGLAPLSVVMADLDHFKAINDSHGHAAGDLLLRHVAAVLGGVLRGGDAVVRFGGEEFLLVLPGVERAQAVRIAERARAAVAGSPGLVGDRRVAVTVSLGVAERVPGEGRDAVIARADAALYRAKQGGRDRVELA